LIGTEDRPDKAPFGHPVWLHIHSFDTTATYGISSRVSTSVTLPFLHGSQSRFYADGLRHQVSAGGLGDVNATGRIWLWSPATHPVGNIQIGLGVKTPTGENEATADFYGLSGTTRYPVDQSVQLGDGGWGIIADTLAFHRLGRVGYAWGTGSYLASPKDVTRIFQQPAGPYSKARVSVPDVFSAKGGLAFTLWRQVGMSGTLAYRFDGLPQHDVFGKSSGFRRPALIGYVDPSVSITHGPSTFQLDVPIRTYYNFRASRLDRQLGTPGGGDLAEYLLFIGYTHRLGGRGQRPMAPASTPGEVSTAGSPSCPTM